MVEAISRDLSEEQLVELTTVVAWENFRARFNRGFDLEAQGFSEGAVCPLPEPAVPKRGEQARGIGLSLRFRLP